MSTFQHVAVVSKTRLIMRFMHSQLLIVWRNTESENHIFTAFFQMKKMSWCSPPRIEKNI